MGIQQANVANMPAHGHNRAMNFFRNGLSRSCGAAPGRSANSWINHCFCLIFSAEWPMLAERATAAAAGDILNLRETETPR
jgi:hypothetical protein